MNQSTKWVTLFLCFMFMYSMGSAQFQTSLDGAEDPPQTTTSSNPNRTTGGAGDAIVDIGINLPSSGKVIQKELPVRWSHKSLQPPFTIVLGMEGGDDLLRANVNTKEYVVDLSTFDFDTDEYYYISVEKQVGDKLHQSKRAKFDVISMDKVDDILANLMETDSYNEATPFIQEMMQAHELGENKFYMQAFDIYMKNIKNESSTRNTMIAINLMKAMQKDKF